MSFGAAPLVNITHQQCHHKLPVFTQLLKQSYRRLALFGLTQGCLWAKMYSKSRKLWSCIWWKCEPHLHRSQGLIVHPCFVSLGLTSQHRKWCVHYGEKVRIRSREVRQPVRVELMHNDRLMDDHQNHQWYLRSLSRWYLTCFHQSFIIYSIKSYQTRSAPQQFHGWNLI